MPLEGQRRVGRFERVHDIIMHEGYTARLVDKKTILDNPYLRDACKKRGEKYDLEKEKSWNIGWQHGDWQDGMTIDGEKL